MIDVVLKKNSRKSRPHESSNNRSIMFRLSCESHFHRVLVFCSYFFFFVTEVLALKPAYTYVYVLFFWFWFLPGGTTGIASFCFLCFSDVADPPRLDDRGTGVSIIKSTRSIVLAFVFTRRNIGCWLLVLSSFKKKNIYPTLHDYYTT